MPLTFKEFTLMFGIDDKWYQTIHIERVIKFT